MPTRISPSTALSAANGNVIPLVTSIAVNRRDTGPVDGLVSLATGNIPSAALRLGTRAAGHRRSLGPIGSLFSAAAGNPLPGILALAGWLAGKHHR